MYKDRKLSREVRKIGEFPPAVLIRSQIADLATHIDTESHIKVLCGIRVCGINVAFLIKNGSSIRICRLCPADAKDHHQLLMRIGCVFCGAAPGLRTPPQEIGGCSYHMNNLIKVS
jgi:hypothetical protein